MRLLDVLRAAGWSENELGNALGVISLESGGNPGAHNTAGEDSVGLFQINRVAHPRYSVEQLKDPAFNATVARQFWQWRGDYRDWWNAAGILGLPPRGTYRHSVDEFASLANKEMGGASNGSNGNGEAGTGTGWVLFAGLLVLALVVWR